MKRLAPLVLAVVVAGCGGGGGSSSSSSSVPSVSSSPPVTLVSAPPPWPAPSVGVSALAAAAGLPMLPQEALNEHIHSHLDVFFNGQPVEVPPYVGIDLVAQAISPLHTHDNTGIVHIESPVQKDYFLGQFLTEWGLKTGNGCVAGSCAVSVYVGGAKVATTPEQVVFHSHDEIALVIGTPPATIPSSYAFTSAYPR